MNTKVRTASEKQITFICTLAEKVGTDLAHDLLVENFSVVSPEDLDIRQASAFIDTLKGALDVARSAERKARADRRVVQEATAIIVEGLDVGVYVRDEKIIRVYPARNGGHLLAKSFDPATGEWNYLGVAARFVRADMKMSLEDAIKFGHDFGVCVACGALLTDPESVAAGIGPVCRTKYFG